MRARNRGNNEMEVRESPGKRKGAPQRGGLPRSFPLIKVQFVFRWEKKGAVKGKKAKRQNEAGGRELDAVTPLRGKYLIG